VGASTGCAERLVAAYRLPRRRGAARPSPGRSATAADLQVEPAAGVGGRRPRSHLLLRRPRATSTTRSGGGSQGQRGAARRDRKVPSTSARSRRARPAATSSRQPP
jgi:hypothetical protein